MTVRSALASRKWLRTVGVLVVTLAVISVGMTSAAEASANAVHVTKAPVVTKKVITNQYVIGFSNGFSGNTWRTEMLASLKSAEPSYPNITLKILDGEGVIATQIGDVDTLIAEHVNALMIIPLSGTALVPAVAKAEKAGIPVVVFNQPLSGSDYAAYVSTDPGKKGAALTKCLVNDLHGTGNVIELGGTPGNSYTAAFMSAAGKVLAGTKIKVLTFRATDYEPSVAKTVTADLLAAYPKIDGVIADGAQDADGAVEAFLAANRPLPTVTGDDYNGILKAFMKYHTTQPTFHLCLQADPTAESVDALQLAVKILEHKPYTKMNILNPPFITDANASKWVRQSLPDGVFVYTNLPTSVLKKLFG
jgi:ribose transport system substrate-binding protein